MGMCLRKHISKFVNMILVSWQLIKVKFMKKLKNDELGRKSAEEFSLAEKLPIVVVLDNVRSAYNVGSVFRTADAFPVESIYLCGITGYPPNKEILKTALGATETVKWKYNKSTLAAIGELKDLGYKIYAVEQVEGSVMLDEFKKQNTVYKIALVFGHEVDGVQQDG
jgi:23S rRNA (guanosine2251-2'-O)-methyltransferase